jgi:hypothetical protein
MTTNCYEDRSRTTFSSRHLFLDPFLLRIKFYYDVSPVLPPHTHLLVTNVIFLLLMILEISSENYAVFTRMPRAISDIIRTLFCDMKSYSSVDWCSTYLPDCTSSHRRRLALELRILFKHDF